MLSDIEIANAATMLPITQVAKDRLGVHADALSPYGHHKAKVSSPSSAPWPTDPTAS